MHNYSSSSLAETPSAVKVNPALARLRILLPGSVIVSSVCLLLLFVPSLLSKAWGPPELYPTYYGTMMLLAIFFLVLAVMVALQMPAVKRLEQKRLRAVRGDSTLLAQTQPPPNEHALDLPFTLTLRYQPSILAKSMFIFLLIFAIFTVFSLFSGFLFPSDSLVPFMEPMFVIIDILLLILLGTQLVALIRRKPPYQLVVTQDELILSKKYRIAWKDARLFAIISMSITSSRNASLFPLIFEVASADSLVRIQWLRSENEKRYALHPLTSFEEYDRQMHALLSVIAAKTGLPLYDLRRP